MKFWGDAVINFFSLSEGKKNHDDKSANDFSSFLISCCWTQSSLMALKRGIITNKEPLYKREKGLFLADSSPFKVLY